MDMIWFRVIAQIWPLYQMVSNKIEDMNKNLENFLASLKEYQTPLVRVSGAFEIGRFHPDKDGLTVDGYLHSVIDGLPQKQINNLETRLQRRLPEKLKEFYKLANGLDVYCGSLIIGGSLDCSGVQPISLHYENLIDLPRTSGGSEIFDEEHIYIGGYSSDKSYIKINIETERILLERDNVWGVYPLEWGSLEEFLWSELERMGEYYSKNHISALEPIPSP